MQASSSAAPARHWAPSDVSAVDHAGHAAAERALDQHDVARPQRAARPAGARAAESGGMRAATTARQGIVQMLP